MVLNQTRRSLRNDWETMCGAAEEIGSSRQVGGHAEMTHGCRRPRCRRWLLTFHPPSPRLVSPVEDRGWRKIHEKGLCGRVGDATVEDALAPAAVGPAASPSLSHKCTVHPYLGSVLQFRVLSVSVCLRLLRTFSCPGYRSGETRRCPV